MKKIWYASALLLLTACGESTVKETLGIDRRAPDEYRVVSRPPLTVPPQFDLRPPSAEGTINSATRDKAQSLVLGNETKKPAVPAGSVAETSFLQKAGTQSADPNIKQELAEKKVNEQVTREEESWWDRLTTLPGSREPVVKAEDEAARIEKNKEEGKPVTEGATPETGGGPVSVLKNLIGND